MSHHLSEERAPSDAAPAAGYVMTSDSNGQFNNVAAQGGFLGEELTATDDVTAGVRSVSLNHATVAVDATMIEVVGADELIIVRNTSASGAAAHTLTLFGSQTWDGTNQTATLDAPGESLVAIGRDATRVDILVNNGGVTFS